MDAQVECRSESSYAEKPVALTWEGERLEIAQILSRWRNPGQSHFRVQVTDGRIFELTYDEAADGWRIQFL